MSSPVEGQFTGTGISDVFTPTRHRGGARNENAGQFNISLGGTDGTVQLQRSFDGFTTSFVVKEYDPATASEIGTEPEPGVQYRLECTVFGVANIPFRLSN